MIGDKVTMSSKFRTINDFDDEDALRLALMDLDIKCKQPERDAAPPEDSREQEEEINSEWDWVLARGEKETSVPQTVADEVRRLQALKSYMILDSEREAVFDRLTSLASRTFDVPIALVSLVDVGRQWFMSNPGLGDVRETSRKVAFCAHAIQQKKPNVFVVRDTLQDSRFLDSPLVLGPPHIRFYAGAPLVSPDGMKLGTFCIIDSKPWPNGMTEKQKSSLQDFAALTMHTMEDRRNLNLRDQQQQNRANTDHMVAAAAYDQVVPLRGLQSSLASLTAAAATSASPDDNLNAQSTALSNAQTTEHLELAAKSADMLERINQDTLASLQVAQKSSMGCSQIPLLIEMTKSHPPMQPEQLFRNLELMARTMPNTVPLHLAMDSTVPGSIIADGLALLRCSLNLLSNALANTKQGSVRFQIFYEREENQLYFECHDTRKIAKVPSGQNTSCNDEVVGLSRVSSCNELETTNDQGQGLSDLARQSFTSQVKTLGGKYGFQPRNINNPSLLESVTWFSVPLAIPKRSIQLDPATSVTLNSTIQPKMPVTKKKDAALAETSRTNGIIEDTVPSRIIQDTVPSGAGNKKDGSRSDQKTAQSTREDSVSPQAMDLLRASVTDESPSDSPVATEVMDAETPKQKRKVLVIEESNIVRQGVSRGFAKLGFEVAEAKTAQSGLEALKGDSFDVVLCDFMMPKSTGIECIRHYRQWEKEQRRSNPQCIIGTSARAGDKDIEQGLSAGMNAFKAKPITSKVLREIIESLDKNQYDKTKSGDLKVGGKRNGISCSESADPAHPDSSQQQPHRIKKQRSGG